MEAIIKIGGSLIEIPQAFKSLCLELSKIAQKHSILIIPGGGKFADIVRELDSKFNLPSLFSHRMAILAMDQYGLFLSQMIPDSRICDSFQEANKIVKSGKTVLFLPSKMLFENDPFNPSWDVTSDSISVYLAIKMQAKKAILVTDVDGIFDKNPKKYSDAKLLPEVSIQQLLNMKERTSVDKFLPSLLQKNSLDCFIVNGFFPMRISEILKTQRSVCTKIVQ